MLGQAFAGTVKGCHHVPPEARRVVVLLILDSQATGDLALAAQSATRVVSPEPGRRRQGAAPGLSPVELPLDQTRPGKEGLAGSAGGFELVASSSSRSGAAVWSGGDVRDPAIPSPATLPGTKLIGTTESRPCRNSTEQLRLTSSGAPPLSDTTRRHARRFDRVFHLCVTPRRDRLHTVGRMTTPTGTVEAKMIRGGWRTEFAVRERMANPHREAAPRRFIRSGRRHGRGGPHPRPTAAPSTVARPAFLTQQGPVVNGARWPARYEVRGQRPGRPLVTMVRGAADRESG